MTTLGLSSSLFVRRTLIAALCTLGFAISIGGFGPLQALAQTKRPSTTKVTKPTKPTNNFRGAPVPHSPWDDKGRFQDSHRGPRVESDRASQSTQPATTQPAAKPAAPVPAFDPEKAPQPIDCFQAFVAAARNARRMDEIMQYLPQSEQERLRAEQARYNPKAVAEEREWFRKLDPEKHTEELLNERFTSPYEGMLKYHKRFANEVRNVTSVTVKDNTAYLTVMTEENVTIGGVLYQTGKTHVELVGEGNYWKMKDHSDSFWRYK